jgi:hypothetical protein
MLTEWYNVGMNDTLKIGMEGVIHGWRWVQVDEVNEDGSGWAVDQDGESHEITIDMFDHIY